MCSSDKNEVSFINIFWYDKFSNTPPIPIITKLGTNQNINSGLKIYINNLNDTFTKISSCSLLVVRIVMMKSLSSHCYYLHGVSSCYLISFHKFEFFLILKIFSAWPFCLRPNFRSSCLQLFFKMVFLKIWQQCRCIPVKSVEFLRISFFTKDLRWLLLLFSDSLNTLDLTLSFQIHKPLKVQSCKLKKHW